MYNLEHLNENTRARRKVLTEITECAFQAQGPLAHRLILSYDMKLPKNSKQASLWSNFKYIHMYVQF